MSKSVKKGDGHRFRHEPITAVLPVDIELADLAARLRAASPDPSHAALGTPDRHLLEADRLDFGGSSTTRICCDLARDSI